MIVEGRSPEDPWIRRSKRSRPCQGVALSAYSFSAAPWRGRISLSGSSFPGFSALRASTAGLKSDDPSGDLPLRDRQAVAVGLGSVNRIAQRQGLSLLCFKAQMRHPWETCIWRCCPATLIGTFVSHYVDDTKWIRIIRTHRKSVSPEASCRR